MSIENKVPMSDFTEVTDIADTARIIGLQDNENVKIPLQSLIAKTLSRVDEDILTVNDINIEGGVTGFNPIGEVKEGDKRAVSGGGVFNDLKKIVNISDSGDISSLGFFVENQAIYHDRDSLGNIVEQEQAILYIIPVKYNSRYEVIKDISNRCRYGFFDDENIPTIGSATTSLISKDTAVNFTVNSNSTNKWLVIYVSNSGQKPSITVLDKTNSTKYTIKKEALPEGVVFIEDKKYVPIIKTYSRLINRFWNSNGVLSVSSERAVTSYIHVDSNSKIIIESENNFKPEIHIFSNIGNVAPDFITNIKDIETNKYTLDLKELNLSTKDVYISVSLKDEVDYGVLNIVENKLIGLEIKEGTLKPLEYNELKVYDVYFEDGLGYSYLDMSDISNKNVKRAKVNVKGFKLVEIPVLTTRSHDGFGFIKKDGTYISGWRNLTPPNRLGASGSKLKVIIPDDAETLFFTYATDSYALANGYNPFDYLSLYSYEYFNNNSGSDIIKKEDFELNSDWRVNESSLGNQINSNITSKITLFETAFNALGHTVESRVIGKSFNDTYEIKGYISTPANGYTQTIAITCHVHGNERHTPLGFIQALGEIKNRKDKINVSLANETRFIVVFMCNPYGYVNNNRLTQQGVNINRNTDYRWALNTTDEPETKGTAPNSAPETKAIVDFFTPFKNEIDYHLDLHDMVYDTAYAPANNKLYKYTEQMNSVRELLEKENNTPFSDRVPYINEMGSVGNFFNENLGINSITLETSRTYWGKRGMSNNFAIAKACEQVMAYLHLYFKLRDTKNSSLFKRDMYTAFKSEEYGINTWSTSKIRDYINRMSYTEVIETNGLKTYNNTIKANKKNVLIVSGYDDTSLNARLSMIRVMELILTMKGYSNELLTNCNLIFLPLESNADINKISELITKYNIDYSLNIESVTDIDTSTNILNIFSDVESNFSKFSKDNYKTFVRSRTGLEVYLNSNYNTIKLANVVPESSRYGFAVVKWFECILNTLISKVF